MWNDSSGYREIEQECQRLVEQCGTKSQEPCRQLIWTCSSSDEVVKNVEHVPFRDNSGDARCGCMFTWWQLVASISQDGSVVLIE